MLSDDLKINDNNATKALNNKLAIKVERELSTMDQKYFDALDNKDLNKLANKLDKLTYLDDNLKDNIKLLISSALFGKIAPELENHSKKFSEAIKKAISTVDTEFPASKWKQDFISLVQKISDDYITR